MSSSSFFLDEVSSAVSLKSGIASSKTSSTFIDGGGVLLPNFTSSFIDDAPAPTASSPKTLTSFALSSL